MKMKMKILSDQDPRHGQYCQGIKDCFGFYANNAAAAQDKLVADLKAEGWTHVENMFGHLPLRGDSRGFVGRQMAAQARRVS